MINRFAGSLFWFSTTLLVIAICTPYLSFWTSSAEQLIKSDQLYLVSLGLLALSVLLARFKLAEIMEPQNMLGALAVLPILFFSDWLDRRFILYVGYTIRGELLLSAICMYLLLHFRQHPLLKSILLACPILLLVVFWIASEGRLIMSDDHPTFMYRLTMLKENFPLIPFYGTLWNGGTDERDFFATGALNVFLLFSPLIYTFPVYSVYNLIVTILLFVLLPVSTYFAVRLLKADHLAAILAGVLAISASFTWYRWALQYGTMGFVTSTVLIPINIALAARYFQAEPIRHPFWWAIGTLISFSLMLLWTPSGLVFVPVILLGLVCIRTLLRHRSFLPLAILIACIHLPWMTLFWSVSQVNTFLEPANVHASLIIVDDDEDEMERVSIPAAKSQIDLQHGIKILREAASSSNFLLFVLTIPGLVLLTTHQARVFLALLLWLPVLACFIGPTKPQLELERMLVVLAIICAVPSGVVLSRLIRSAQSRTSFALVAFALGFLFAGIFGTAATIRGRNLLPIYYEKEYVSEMVRELPELSRGGRILFSGFVLHEFNEGHLAPLAVWSGVPMVASSQVHNLWYYKQVFPAQALREGRSGRERYLDLLNVSVVAAHEPFWRAQFRDDPEYAFAARFGKFAFYSRKNFPDSFVYSGEAEIVETTSSRITLHAKTSNVILRYRYYPWVTATGCSISALPAGYELELIALSDCTTAEPITIHSVSPLKRLSLELSKDGE